MAPPPTWPSRWWPLPVDQHPEQAAKEVAMFQQARPWVIVAVLVLLITVPLCWPVAP